MPFEFCAKHSKRFERGYSVCAGCYHEHIQKWMDAASVNETVNRAAPVNTVSRRDYMREYMRKRRAS